jgi:thiamine biosynthesis lipoprotein
MRTSWIYILILLALSACAPRMERYTFQHEQMGTAFRLVLYASDSDSARHAADAAWRRIDELNAQLSDWDQQSELSKLSRTSGSGQDIKVGSDLWAILTRAESWSRRSDGAFDITVGPAVRLWRRYRKQHKRPPPERLDKIKPSMGYQKIVLDPVRRTAQLTAPNMWLDLGGIAKGYAADEALRTVRAAGWPIALVDAGGDLALGDPPPGRAGWRVGLMPQPDLGSKRYLIVSRCAVATSGDAFRYTLIDGARYSHIVNPKTGLGLVDAAAVTVVAPDGATADALASAVSVLGPTRGAALIEQVPGAAAAWMDPPAKGGRIYETTRFKKLWIEAAPPPTTP